MDQFFLNYKIPAVDLTIAHGDGIILSGSCFSDEIALKLKQSGHQYISNIHGTIFHPSVLAFNLMDALNTDLDQRTFERDGKWYSWNTSTSVSALTKDALQQELLQRKQLTKAALEKAKALIVTFGTAWGYELKDREELVANCHKMPQQLFNKFLSSPYELVQDWILALEQLRAVNPDLHVIFTVSPVRHVKDGLVENNLSKARLIEAVQQLTLEENTSYFPSYELVIDVLRDYRFYKEDRVHPNQEAIDYVWQKFSETYMDSATCAINEQVEKTHRFAQHRPTSANDEHQKLVASKQEELTKKYPAITW